MPELWFSLLQSSKITKQEQKENPQAVLDALDFYQNAAKKRESKFMYSSCKSKRFSNIELFYLRNENLLFILAQI